jgi:Tfp pilus assembly protein PilO
MAEAPAATKRVQVNKATATIVAVVGAASFVTVFSLVACKALLSQRAYQSRVITEKEKAKKQLIENAQAVESLKVQYKAFVETGENVLGGNPKGSGEKDGDNARVVLDALPSKYDFPALTASLEKLLTGNNNFKIDTIAGSDDELAQDAASTQGEVKPVEMPFQIGITGNYQSIQDLTKLLERSIRPIAFQSINMDGTESEMKYFVSATTYYQPTKKFNVTTKEVK